MTFPDAWLPATATVTTARAFEYILRGAFFGMMLSWIISLAAHIQFRRRMTPEQEPERAARSPLGKWGSIVGLAVVLACVGETWFDSRVNLISGLAMLIGLTVAYAVIKQSRQRDS